MWDRKELKDRAKGAFKQNYWKSVLVALILTLFGGDANRFFTLSSNNFSSFNGNSSMFDDEEITALFQFITPELIATVLGVVLIIWVISILIKVFVLNPFLLGTYQFSKNTLRENGKLSDLGSGFDNCYLRNVKVLFLRDLFVFLWTLLFVIPGIIKFYEYKMIPYLLTEYPEMDRNEAFQISKRMMQGNIGKAFVLDLSFILWIILSVLTCGLVGVFWFCPYKMLTDAALYEALKSQPEMVQE